MGSDDPLCTMPTPPVLYSYFRSSCSWRVRIALAVKGVEYETHSVHLIKDGGQQHGAEFRALNPMAQVPCLAVDGAVITQSLAIMEFIEEKFPSNSLLPENTAKRAKVREICEVIGSGIQPIQNLSVINHVAGLVEADKAGQVKAEWGKHYISKGFDALEQLLAGCSGECCVGDDVTLADCCLVPQVFNARRFKVDMEKYPIISKIESHLNSLAAFKAAHPTAQPDCPDELKSSGM